MRSSHRIAVGAAALALLTACGGGGGGDEAADDFADGSAKEILEAAATDMKAVEMSPKRRSQGVPLALGGARRIALFQGYLRSTS